MATKKYVNFLERHDPPMEAGEYEIRVKQSLGATSKGIAEKFWETKRKFFVAGDRFLLNPGAVHSVYPPPGSLGEHTKTFPHLILNRSTLPWERSVDTGTDGTWLALLLFDEAETPKPMAVPLSTAYEKLNADGKEIIGAIAATKQLGDGDLEEPITVIRVKKVLLDKIMPTKADLAIAAHSRREGEGQDTSSFRVTAPERAVIIGTRLPKANERSTVHLVSLENRFGSDGKFDYGNAEDEHLITLVSLHSWSFRSVNAKFSLFGMLEHLNRVPSQLSRPFLNDQVLNLRGMADETAYGFAVTPSNNAVTEPTPGTLFFNESGHLSVEVPDSATDADQDPQLDPFPEPREFTIAMSVRVTAVSDANRYPLLGAKEDSPQGERFKPSLWQVPGVFGAPEIPNYLAYKVSSEDGQLFEGKIPVQLSGEAFEHIVCVKDGTEFRFYVNGQMVAAHPAPARMYTNDSPYLIGATEAGEHPKFLGHLRQLHIFRRALPQGEIKTLFSENVVSVAGIVNEQLAEGMVALPQHFRKGKKGVSWYRGPLSVRTAKPGFDLPAVAADQLLVFDQHSGMFDTSYAAAWQLGRLMALEDQQFSLELYHWKRKMSVAQKQQWKKGHLPFRPMQDDAAPKVTLFEQTAFGGKQKTLTASWTGIEGGTITEWNDRINSIQVEVPAGWEVEIYQHVRFEGEKKVLTGHWDAADEEAWKNRISSIKIKSPLEQRIREWMKKRHLLQGVPFQYLVPEEDMLPPESLRFFNLDPTWVACLKDGAASIGRTSSADLELDKLENLADDPVPAMSGFLLRSELVSGYPGLQILGYAGIFDALANPDVNTALPILHRKKLSDEVLLCIFEGDLGTVDFFQKPDVLHFGLDSDGKGNFAKQLRKADGTLVNIQIDLAPNAARVVGFAAAAAGMGEKLVAELDDDAEFADFTSADFALQMLEGAERVRFARRKTGTA